MNINYQEPDLRKVYDLVNVEHGFRFVVYGKDTMVVSNCQSTGSDITMMWTAKVADLVKERNIDARPCVYNFHDESIWYVENNYINDMKEVYTDACDYVNQVLHSHNWICKLKVDPSTGQTLWDIKND